VSEAIETKPRRIALIKEAMAELGRADLSMRDALRESNDERHQEFFSLVLDHLGLIIANERDGLTLTLADDLANARSELRRLRLSDIDPELEAPTPALRALRSERGNLIEAIDNALDAAASLGLHPRAAELGSIHVERREIAEQLVRLDERLRALEVGVTGLFNAAEGADATLSRNLPAQSALVNIHV
jgi:hypothetical protein